MERASDGRVKSDPSAVGIPRAIGGIERFGGRTIGSRASGGITSGGISSGGITSGGITTDIATDDGHDDVAMTMLDGDRPWSGCDIDQQWSERQASGASEPEGAK